VHIHDTCFQRGGKRQRRRRIRFRRSRSGRDRNDGDPDGVPLHRQSLQRGGSHAGPHQKPPPDDPRGRPHARRDLGGGAQRVEASAPYPKTEDSHPEHVGGRRIDHGRVARLPSPRRARREQSRSARRSSAAPGRRRHLPHQLPNHLQGNSLRLVRLRTGGGQVVPRDLPDQREKGGGAILGASRPVAPRRPPAQILHFPTDEAGVRRRSHRRERGNFEEVHPQDQTPARCVPPLRLHRAGGGQSDAAPQGQREERDAARFRQEDAAEDGAQSRLQAEVVVEEAKVRFAEHDDLQQQQVHDESGTDESAQHGRLQSRRRLVDRRFRDGAVVGAAGAHRRQDPGAPGGAELRQGLAEVGVVQRQFIPDERESRSRSIQTHHRQLHVHDVQKVSTRCTNVGNALHFRLQLPGFVGCSGDRDRREHPALLPVLPPGKDSDHDVAPPPHQSSPAARRRPPRQECDGDVEEPPHSERLHRDHLLLRTRKISVVVGLRHSHFFPSARVRLGHVRQLAQRQFVVFGSG
jgi:hypothetical protein